MTERIFDNTDMYQMITGLALTEKQLQELGERQQKILKPDLKSKPREKVINIWKKR